jgi:hypothetical protein
MKRTRGEHGFGFVEALLTILVITVLAFAGYFVWYTHHTLKPADPPTPVGDSAIKSTSPSQSSTPVNNDIQYKSTLSYANAGTNTQTTINHAFHILTPSCTTDAGDIDTAKVDTGKIRLVQTTLYGIFYQTTVGCVGSSSFDILIDTNPSGAANSDNYLHKATDDYYTCAELTTAKVTDFTVAKCKTSDGSVVANTYKY